jgi:hypothetical protein
VDRLDVVPRPAPSSIAGFDRRQLVLIAALFALAAVRWIVTDQRMAGMDAGPGTDPGSLGFYVTAWVVMMGAMMSPPSSRWSGCTTSYSDVGTAPVASARPRHS